MRQEELRAERRSIDLIGKLQSLKKHKIRQIEDSEDRLIASEDFEIVMNKAVDQLEDSLMEIEMRLQYGLMDAVDEYKLEIKKDLDSIKAQTDVFIKHIDSFGEEFNNELKAMAELEYKKWEKEANNEAAKNNEEIGEEEEEENQLFNLFEDKETLDEILDTSRTVMQKLIQSTESHITKAIENEQNAITNEIIKSQHSRSRGIIREIIQTCMNFKNEIKTDADLLKGDDDQ